MSQSSRPTAVDVFCGAGGLSLGFEQAGFDIAVGIDYDQNHARTHQRNFPFSHTIIADVANLNGKDICHSAGVKREDIDVIIGGPPCQGFSVIGKKQQGDPRNRGLFEFARIVQDLQPSYFVVENVEGLMRSSSQSIRESFLDTLRKARYSIVKPIQVLNSQDFGVPQHRRRVFFIGYKPSLPVPFYPKNNQKPIGKNCISSPSVWDAISDLAILDNDTTLFREDSYSGGLGLGTEYSKTLRGNILDPFNFYKTKKKKALTLTGCRRSIHTDKIIKRFSNTLPGTIEPISRLHRLTKEGVSNTLRAGSGRLHGSHTAPRPIHPEFPRCITVREAARLHSFPDWFQFDPTIWHGFRQIGNSVPPFLARAVARSVKLAIDKKNDNKKFNGE